MPTRFLKTSGARAHQDARIWAGEGQDYSYEELTQLAEEAPAFGPLVDPDHHGFLSPGDMPSRIRRFCEATGQETPEEPGEIARCVFESLAMKYRWVVEQAGEITGQRVEENHVAAGESQNYLLWPAHRRRGASPGPGRSGRGYRL